MKKNFRIIGIDPGLIHAGWGVIDINNTNISYLDSGVIKVSSNQPLDLRLQQLFIDMKEVIIKYQPDYAAIEETFLNKNPATTLKLGLARGALMVAPLGLDVRVAQYSANCIKKTVVGAGHADKNQVKVMIGYLLPTCPTTITYDAADALATAICHAHTLQTTQIWDDK